MPILNHSFFSTTDLFKQCLSSNERLLAELAYQLEKAWSSLIANDEAESLMEEVKRLIDCFSSSHNPYPTFGVKGNDLSDRCRQAVKYASAYAGLAAMAVRDGNSFPARQLIVDALLILFHGYRPCSEEVYNNHLSRQGGAARSAQWRQPKDELYNLIEKEIRTRRKPFNSKKEAAEYFAAPLNKATKHFKIDNSGPSMSKTIQHWFSTDKKLKPLIENLVLRYQKAKTLAR